MQNRFSKVINFLRKTWFIIFAVLLIAGAGISSVRIIQEEVLNIDPDVKRVESGSLFLSCEPIDTLNPILTQNEDIYHLSKLIYNSLFDFDENLNVTPELVSDYSVDTKSGKVSCKLKKGIEWHDGKKLTANDVRFTITAIQNAGKQSVYYDKASKISFVNVKGTREFEIYFKNAYNASLDYLTFPIVPSGQYATAGAFASARDNFKPVGTGQYQYQSFNYLKHLRLKPNEKYFGDVATKKIKVMILPEKQLSSNMLELNSVTCYLDKTSERKSTVIDKKLKMYDVLSNEVEFLVFNPLGKDVKEKKVRQAIAYAINEQNVLENGYMSDGVLADTVYYPNFCGVSDTNAYYNYDIDKCHRLMNESGYKDIDNNGIFENSEKKELELKLLVNKNNATRLAASSVIAKDLENAGFKVVTDELPWKEYVEAIKHNRFDILVTGFTMEECYDLKMFFDGKNEWHYKNLELMTKAQELEMLHTASEYTQIFSELKEMMLDELPYYSLCYKKFGLVGVEGFNAEKVPMFNDYYKNIETWFWTYVKEEKPVKEENIAEE